MYFDSELYFVFKTNDIIMSMPISMLIQLSFQVIHIINKYLASEYHIKIITISQLFIYIDHTLNYKNK